MDCQQYPGTQGCAPPHHTLPFTGFDLTMLGLLGFLILTVALGLYVISRLPE